ncbi:NarK family nitrate/nitrite MFS transporter [Streptomyces sp. WAC06614]|uniref:NarK family nitrate/nitrite MFS transporter n=1 Tax=Streptomyces sp. WAC06614 TaxID=2487416 RepID=UPI000F77B424|nr:NarK family nitrate/nitrite MFS transporter [Streptomyces sp. WAC06614]RSS80208.1 NarK family nitrate/nitrite MFS transporter [Streptomyces sp. WAC06614]
MSTPTPTPTTRTGRHRGDSYRPGTTVVDWRPEDSAFWQATGRRVAQRNLWISIPALMLGFVVWQVWSVTVVKLGDVGFGFSKSQLFWLTAVPGLTGGTFRILYTFIGPMVGERKFTALSTLVLVAPMLWLGFALQDTGTPYWELVLIAAVCGIGGANFASSMANIGFFFPKREKGSANGLNGGLGNLGVSVVQLVAPLVVTAAVLGPPAGGPQLDTKENTDIWLQNGAFLWVPLLVVMALLAWFLMNDLKVAAAPFREQKIIFRRKHTWLMTWLYVGTFGSFIGFAAGLPLLIKNNFESQGYQATTYAWIGPFIGALMRWAGGWLSDRIGGARVTLLSFVGMAASLVVVIFALPTGGDQGSFWTFFAGFLAAFFFSGLGNGSTFRQIPVIFRDQHVRAARGKGPDELNAAVKQSETEAGAVTGFSSAIAAYGFFFIPAMFANLAVTTALWMFIVFYATCLAVCWWYYARQGAEAPS